MTGSTSHSVYASVELINTTTFELLIVDLGQDHQASENLGTGVCSSEFFREWEVMFEM